MPARPSYTSVDVAVVGGGIAGACLAEELARGGAKVTVLDAGPVAGRATRQAAGVAVPSARYLSDPEFHAWLVEARGHLDADIARLEPGYGAFSVARPIVRALRSGQDPVGLEGHWAEPGELTGLTTGLRLPDTRRYHVADGLMIDGGRYLDAVRAAARALSVDWRQGTTVLDLVEDTDGVVVGYEGGSIRAQTAVLAAGAWTAASFAPELGVRPQRGQMVRLETDVELPCILSSAFYLAPAVGGGVVVGATEEDAGFAERTTLAGVHRLLGFAAAVAPDLASAQPVELRAGLRPVSQGGRPLVGRVPDRNRVYVDAGHAGHGLLSARCTAVGLAAGLLRDDWFGLPEAFCPTRGRATTVAG